MRSFYETISDRNDYIFLHEFENNVTSAHFHKSLEFVYCLEGKIEFFINGEFYIVEKDEIFAAPSYAVHSNKHIGETKMLTCIFAHNYLHDFEKIYPEQSFAPVLRNKEQNRKILPLLMDFYWNYIERYHYLYNNISFLKRQAFIDEFLFQLTSAYSLFPIEQKKSNNTTLDILSYINEHYTENLTLEFLSQKYGYCPKYFSELFNKHVGCKLNTYINSIRTEKAIAELNNPKNKKSLTSIAFDNGFNSLATFYRILSKTDYKKKQKNLPAK